MPKEKRIITPFTHLHKNNSIWVKRSKDRNRSQLLDHGLDLDLGIDPWGKGNTEPSIHVK